MRGLGTRNPLLRYGIDTRCQKRHPTVRDAFSEALRAQNRLLGYGREIRYQKHPSTVQGAVRPLLRYGVHLQSAVQERASSFLAFVVFSAGNVYFPDLG